MMYACYRGDKTSIRHLLAKGADPYLRENVRNAYSPPYHFNFIISCASAQTGRSAIDLCNNAVTREFLQKEV